VLIRCHEAAGSAAVPAALVGSDHASGVKCMRPSPFHYFPLTADFLLALVVLVAALIALVEINVLKYAYEKIGVDRRYVFAVLALSLLGSYVNIPVAQFPPERVVSNEQVLFFGMRYVVPVVEQWPGTVVAVNVGGAIVPTLLSIYLLIVNRIYLPAAIGTAVMTVLIHWMATPLPGVGIAVPMFVPPLLAAGIALVLSRHSAPALAYVTGSLGTLVGADLLNLARFQGLGAPIASIGGAGTFDGIFLTGILAVLLA
jgi:uncharacterized membrane protein